MFEQDETTGELTASTTEGVIQVDDSGKYVDFGLVVTSEASIQYVCTGLLEDLNPTTGAGLGTYTQRTEKRVIEYKSGETTKYTINGAEVAYGQTLPAEVTLVLNNVALIGHSDTVDSINSSTDYFRYYSKYGMIL